MSIHVNHLYKIQNFSRHQGDDDRQEQNLSSNVSRHRCLLTSQLKGKKEKKKRFFNETNEKKKLHSYEYTYSNAKYKMLKVIKEVSYHVPVRFQRCTFLNEI